MNTVKLKSYWTVIMRHQGEIEAVWLEDKIIRAYINFTSDKRIGVWHISLYLALLYRWHENEYVNPIQITRREIMKLAHVGSNVTYHKLIKQLQEFEYIKYLPSYHPTLGSQVYLGKIC